MKRGRRKSKNCDGFFLRPAVGTIGNNQIPGKEAVKTEK